MEKILTTGEVLCQLVREHFFEIKKQTLKEFMLQEIVQESRINI